VPSAGEYYVLTHDNGADDPAVDAVRNWILKEAAKVRPFANQNAELPRS
jgi:hypothetical protein